MSTQTEALDSIKSGIRCRMGDARRDAREAITKGNALLLAASVAREDALMEVLSEFQWMETPPKRAGLEG
jgi:hypothetical protein